MNPNAELAAAKAISGYLGKKLAFDAATSETQEALELLGWKWVAKDIAEYSENHRYQYWLVSPEMYELLDIDFTDCTGREYETPVLCCEPDSKWQENVHYILF